ncbi:MAG: Haloacid dehalogenase-like hydrolase [Pseudomonadota bacterium]|jgi:beta-phosphoglucomutase-like phosphatase (HAD superfamily)
MTIEYRSQPDHVHSCIQQYGIRFVGWDMDGTLANTERLHRAICRSALQEVSGSSISERAFRAPVYRSAFGLPGQETSLQLARALRETNPEGFQHALQSALSKGIHGDACDTVARAIAELREETFSFYLDNTTLRSTNHGGGMARLALAPHAQEQDFNAARRLEVLRDVEVHTYPYVLEALATFERLGLAQGVCTSSGKSFARPLIAALGIGNFFEAIVTADCIQNGQHKPDPRPWHVLRTQLDPIASQFGPTQPIRDMLFIENSAGGAFSCIRAGTGPTFVISDNIAGTSGKMLAKVQAAQDPNSPVPIHGKAIFINNLGDIVLPKRPQTQQQES